MSNWLSELLDALERHTQATQANTAAVRSLLSVAVVPADALAARSGVLVDQLTAQLAEARAITARLEALRDEVASTHDPVRCHREPSP